MTHFLSMFFEDKQVGDPNFTGTFQLEVNENSKFFIESEDNIEKPNQHFYPLKATVQWAVDKQGSRSLKATVEKYDVNQHDSPEKYQVSKEAIFEAFQQYGAPYDILFVATPLDNTKNTFNFRLMPFQHYKTKPKETRATLKHIMKGNHPYLQLTEKPSLLEFATQQTPPVRSILRSTPGRHDRIYQSAKNKQNNRYSTKNNPHGLCLAQNTHLANSPNCA